MSLNQAGQTLSSKECISGEEAWDKMCLGRAGCIAYCAGRQAGNGEDDAEANIQ